MAKFEIGFLHKNPGSESDNNKPVFRGSLKIDGEEIRIVVFRSEKDGKPYLTIKPDRPNPNASAGADRNNSGPPRRYGQQAADLDADIPF